MKGLKTMIFALCAAFLMSSCGDLTNKAKGGMIGGASGGAIGALVGQLIGHGKGAAIGAAVGTAVGAGAGVLIGNKMDKAKKAAEQLDNAQAELLQDAQGLSYVKVTFDSGILFSTSSATLTSSAQSTLSKFVSTALTSDMDLAIVGFTDNTGWKNCTAEQSIAKNQTLSEQRAQSVSSYLISKGASASQMKSVIGKGQENPVADNTTAEGRAQNRRVEVYMLPSQQMIEAANNGTLN